MNLTPDLATQYDADRFHIVNKMPASITCEILDQLNGQLVVLIRIILN
jgi:hypothetical protein